MTFTFSDPVYIAILNQSSGGGVDACRITLNGSITGGGDSFECLVPAAPFTGAIASGQGWSGAAAYGMGYTGQIALDTFETYPVGAIGTLSDGTGWNGSWVIR